MLGWETCCGRRMTQHPFSRSCQPLSWSHRNLLAKGAGELFPGTSRNRLLAPPGCGQGLGGGDSLSLSRCSRSSSQVDLLHALPSVPLPPHSFPAPPVLPGPVWTPPRPWKPFPLGYSPLRTPPSPVPVSAQHRTEEHLILPYQTVPTLPGPRLARHTVTPPQGHRGAHSVSAPTVPMGTSRSSALPTGGSLCPGQHWMAVSPPSC